MDERTGIKSSGDAEDDDLRSAKGAFIGLCLGVVFWVAVIAVLWWL